MPKSPVNIGTNLQELSGAFQERRKKRKNGDLKCDLFYKVMEMILKKADVHKNGTILEVPSQLLLHSL